MKTYQVRFAGIVAFETGEDYLSGKTRTLLRDEALTPVKGSKKKLLLQAADGFRAWLEKEYTLSK